MQLLLLSKNEKAEIRKIQIANEHEILGWQLPNIYYPFCVIGFSLVAFLLFKESANITAVALLNLFLNGSIPMVALNRLSSLGVNLFKFDKSKEKDKSKKDTYNLRIKIHYYSQALVFSIAIFYVYQVINTPFPLSWWIFLQMLVSAFCVYQAIQISKCAYLLQEKMIDNTYDQEVRNEIEENGHGQNW